DRGEIAPGLDDHTNLHLAAGFDTGLNQPHQCGSALTRVLEDDVAAVDIGDHVSQSEILKTGFQLLHAHHHVSAHVDSAEQCDIGREFRCLFHVSNDCASDRTERDPRINAY